VFSASATYYDKIYSFKDYRTEALKLLFIISEYLCSEENRLLDVACGTGRHIGYLKELFDVEGLDISQELLDLARRRNPGITFHHADMMNFDLHSKFHVITCLFSSIGYLKTLDNLARAVDCMTRHLLPGGILVIEPWFTPEAWHSGTVHSLFIDEPYLKIARVNTSFADGRLSFFDLHYLIGTPEGTDHFVEHHELGLFETDEIRAVLGNAGLEVTYDSEGLIGRGLFIGRRPQ